MSYKIGQGLQCIVYDGGDRVRKVPTSILQIITTLCYWYPSYRWHWDDLKRKTDATIKERDQVIEIIQQRDIDLSLLGNPIFQGNVIWQDKVTMLGEFLRQTGDPNKIIDLYIDFLQRCWGNGFYERTHKPTQQWC